MAQRGPGLRIKFEHIGGLTERTLLRDPFYFQCAPLDAFTRSLAFSHTDYETLGGHQHSTPGAMQLRSFTFNTLAVDWGAPWTLLNKLPLNAPKDLRGQGVRLSGPVEQFAVEIPTPLQISRELEKLLESGTPFYMSAHSPILWQFSEIPQGRLPVTMRQLEVEERAGEVDARYFNINLVEFRRPIIYQRAKGAASKKVPVTLFVRNLPNTRATLYKLAKWYYGSSAKWRVISKANGWKIAPSINLKTHFKKQKNRKIRIPALRK
jgi:hypothetical protein